MALTDHTHSSLPGIRLVSPLAFMGHWLTVRAAASRRRRLHRRALKELLSMEDSRLRDLGLRRADIHAALTKRT